MNACPIAAVGRVNDLPILQEMPRGGPDRRRCMHFAIALWSSLKMASSISSPRAMFRTSELALTWELKRQSGPSCAAGELGRAGSSRVLGPSEVTYFLSSGVAGMSTALAPRRALNVSVHRRKRARGGEKSTLHLGLDETISPRRRARRRETSKRDACL